MDDPRQELEAVHDPGARPAEVGASVDESTTGVMEGLGPLFMACPRRSLLVRGLQSRKALRLVDWILFAKVQLSHSPSLAAIRMG